MCFFFFFLRTFGQGGHAFLMANELAFGLTPEGGIASCRQRATVKFDGRTKGMPRCECTVLHI